MISGYYGRSRCKFVKWVVATCESGHQSRYPIGCKNCDGCMQAYKSKFIMRALEKHRLGSPDVSSYVFWTIGTNWDEYRLPDLRKAWKSFRNVMNHYKWKPCVYAIETGSKGGKLHIHFLVEAGMKLEHTLVKSKWQDQVGLDHAHTNYSFPRICHNCKYWNKLDKPEPCKNCALPMSAGNFSRPPPRKGIEYIAKYLAKQHEHGIKKHRYYWLGRWYKNKMDKRKGSCRYATGATWDVKEKKLVWDFCKKALIDVFPEFLTTSTLSDTDRVRYSEVPKVP